MYHNELLSTYTHTYLIEELLFTFDYRLIIFNRK